MDYDLLWSNLNAELRFKETESGGLSAALAGLENTNANAVSFKMIFKR